MKENLAVHFVISNKKTPGAASGISDWTKTDSLGYHRSYQSLKEAVFQVADQQIK